MIGDLVLGHSETPVAAGPPEHRSATATSQLYYRLRNDIMQGRLAPGERLRIELLRTRYAVGSSPIREALNRLSSEELVIQVEQKGFRVADVSIEDLNELTRSRCLLNEIVLREAIANGDDTWEEAIVLAFHRMSRIQRAPEPDLRLLDHHHRVFHESLIAACGSKWLRNLAMVMFDSAERYRKLSQTVSAGRNSEQEHQDIMQATLRRDTETAVRLLNEHAVQTARIIADAWSSETRDLPELKGRSLADS